MKNLSLAALLMFLSFPAGAWEAGYSVLHHRARDNTSDAARGFDFRVNFGGEHGDRWSIAAGAIKARGTGPKDDWIDTPFGCCAQTDTLPKMRFVSAVHRWYTQPWHGLRFWAGTGLAYRDVKTCTEPHKRRGIPALCWRGSAEVSSAWAFHQSFGVKWRALELSYEHDSTARISTLNLGEDVFRLGFLAKF